MGSVVQDFFTQVLGWFQRCSYLQLLTNRFSEQELECGKRPIVEDNFGQYILSPFCSIVRR